MRLKLKPLFLLFALSSSCLTVSGVDLPSILDELKAPHLSQEEKNSKVKSAVKSLGWVTHNDNFLFFYSFSLWGRKYLNPGDPEVVKFSEHFKSFPKNTKGIL